MILLNKTYKEKIAMKGIQHFVFTILGFIMLLGIHSCSGPEPTSEANEAEISGNGEVILSKEQIDLAGMEFGKIEQRMLSGDVDARGKLLLPQNGKATISPVIRGVVISIEVMPGQFVHAGQVLAHLTHPDYVEIQEQYLSTINSLEYLENEFDRQKRLYDEKVSSEKKYLQAKTEYQGAKAKLAALQLMIEQIGIDPSAIAGGKIFSQIPVKTPIDGMVDAILVNLGQNVAEGDPLFEITCRKKLFVELEVFEKDIIKIRKGQRVSFSLANVDNKMYEAEVISIGGSVQQAGRVVKVLAAFENTNEYLFPGMFVASEIHTGEEILNAVPSGAIMNYGSGNPYVYFTTGQEGSESFSFSRVAVKTGFEEDDYVQIDPLDVIPPNARIVTKGGYYVQAEEGKGE